MEVLIVETANTMDATNIDKILSKHVICRSDADKKKYLRYFTQPTCTKDPTLLKLAKEYERILA